MLLINDDLIWLSIPRCASTSIEIEFFSSGLDIKYAGDNRDKAKLHQHNELNTLYSYFGHKETVCVTRNWFDRWMSGFNHIWTAIYKDNLTPIVKFEDVDNDFIYNNFGVDFLKRLYTLSDEESLYCYSKLVKEDLDYLIKNSDKLIFYTSLRMLMSQSYWKSNQQCTYEFDITELTKFEKFIENRYNIEFKLDKINESKNIGNKIIINDELKTWVWEIYEMTPFLKKKKTIL